MRLLSEIRNTTVALPFMSSLAVAGRSGTLRKRMRGTAAAGACAGKTGTLNSVSSLVGVCTARGGHLLAFAILMNGVSDWRAHAAQDHAALAITSYSGASLASLPSSSSSSPASSTTSTPSFSAFSSFDPGLSPATT